MLSKNSTIMITHENKASILNWVISKPWKNNKNVFYRFSVNGSEKKNMSWCEKVNFTCDQRRFQCISKKVEKGEDFQSSTYLRTISYCTIKPSLINYGMNMWKRIVEQHHTTAPTPLLI